MRVQINSIHGIDDALRSLYMSKRNYDDGVDMRIKELTNAVLDRNGFVKMAQGDALDVYNEKMDTLIKWGVQHGHTTLMRYIDISVTVFGLHRGAMDDFDSHAKRLDNRIVRASTRLAKFGADEKSEYYQGKILSLGEAMDYIQFPDRLVRDKITYVKTEHGYINEEYIGTEEEQDVMRGLYKLSIPCNFIFKVQLPELGHIYNHRNANTTAHPELKLMVELLRSELGVRQPKLALILDQFNI